MEPFAPGCDEALFIDTAVFRPHESFRPSNTPIGPLGQPA